jgi:hypothetical protein
MSQISKLPGLKTIALTPAQLLPPSGSTPVGVADDGRVIWEGPIFDGNPFFQQNAVSDDGHPKTPRKGPDGKDMWRKNKATGENITPMFNARRSHSLRQFVMTDMGNGNAGPRPVPGLSDAEKTRREKQKLVDGYIERLSRAAVEEGMTPEEFVKTAVGLSGTATTESEADAKIAAMRAEIDALKASLVQSAPEVPEAEAPAAEKKTPKKKASRKKKS